MKAIEILVDYRSFVGIHFDIDDQVRIERAIEYLKDLKNRKCSDWESIK